MVSTILLLLLMAVVVYTDIAQHKIYNWTTYPGMLAALGLNALCDWALRMGWLSEERLHDFGWISLGTSFGGLCLCGVLMLVCFVFFRVGGGDVKLIAMMGAFLGVDNGIRALMLTFLIGGCAGLILLVWRVGAWRLVSRVFRQLVASLRIFHWSPLTDEERAPLQAPLFLAPSALAAVILVELGLAQWVA